MNYWQLLFSRIGVGVGEAGGTPGASSLLSDYFPASQRPMALTIFALGASIGAWIGADVAGQLAEAYGWRHVFLLLGIPGVDFGLLIFLTVREPKRGQLDLNKSEVTPSFGATFKYLLQQRSAVWLGGAGVPRDGSCATPLIARAARRAAVVWQMAVA